MGVQSVNLIVGVCFTKRKGCAVTETTLHHIDDKNPICPNKYERVIWIIGKTIKALNQNNSIRCFGFGDATTLINRIFRFFNEESHCPGYAEAALQYRCIAKHARLTERVSYDRIIRKAICVARETSDRHHVLVIIASEPVSRSPDTKHGRLSDDEQKTVDAIAIARNYRLSIVLVSIGETNENMMKELKKKVSRSDNVTFVDYTRIMLADKPFQTRQREFCLAVFENLPREITERHNVSSNPAIEVPLSLPPPIPPT